MLDVLARVEADLPALLADESGWNSLDIDYHPPRVERLWRSWGDGYRVSLHRIHPCEPQDALFHPHPWASAMRVCDGVYEMAIGYGPGSAAPPIAARLVATGDLRYEMTDVDAWHYVRPIGGPAMTVMVTSRPWQRDAAGAEPGAPLSPLAPGRRTELIAWFRAFYAR
ncbi:MAG TPA: hypothetical protein VLE97_09070 [Gaiellaceae bacterium]|nr:hypothetical protein [Gaiellaceae bacterium]